MSILIKSNNKTRDLSVFQLFDVLQEEFIVCELRIKIYPMQKHKDYWIDLSQKKKEKILDISKRNFLPSIFDDKRIKQDFERRIIPDIGYPKFLYKDATQRLIQEKWDLHNYYTRGSEVKVMDDTGRILNGSIISVNLNNRTARIQIKDIDICESYSFDIITRIL